MPQSESKMRENVLTVAEEVIDVVLKHFEAMVSRLLVVAL